MLRQLLTLFINFFPCSDLDAGCIWQIIDPKFESDAAWYGQVIYYFQISLNKHSPRLNLALVSVYTDYRYVDESDCVLACQAVPLDQPNRVFPVDWIASVVAVIPRHWHSDFLIVERLGLGFKEITDDTSADDAAQELL
jgi:hypothetical protein